MQVNFTMALVCDLNVLYDVCNFNEALPYMEGLLEGAENGADVRILIKGAPVDGIESGVAVAILEKENAVADFRELIGATNPAEAAEGTIRKLYARSLQSNAVHGSDSDENAQIEGSFYFSDIEKF